MQIGTTWGLVALLGLTCATARAETFMGVEGQGDEAGEASQPEEEQPAPKKKAKPKKPPREEEEDASEAPAESGGGRFSFALVLGGSSHYISGQAILGYAFNRYVGIDTNFFYYRYDDADTTGNQYGPEVDLVFRLPNPTIITPFVGAGPGYYKWVREYKGVAFDDNSSFTINDFAGINIALTKHFGLHLMRKQVMYVGAVPKDFDSRSTSEPRSQMETDIGFHANF